MKVTIKRIIIVILILSIHFPVSSLERITKKWNEWEKQGTSWWVRWKTGIWRNKHLESGFCFLLKYIRCLKDSYSSSVECCRGTRLVLKKFLTLRGYFLAHGLGKISGTSSRCLRVIWSLIFLASFSIFCYQVAGLAFFENYFYLTNCQPLYETYMLIVDYLTWPVTMSMSVVNQQNSGFIFEKRFSCDAQTYKHF